MNDDTPLPHEDDTRTGIRALRSDVTALDRCVREMRDQRGRTVKIVSAVVGAAMTVGLLPLGGTLIGIGEVRAEQRQVRADVARVLVAVETLGRQSATVSARQDESARDRAALRESVRALDEKIWMARRRAEDRQP